MENNAILSALSARKSVRVFTPDPVTPDERAAILNAAFQAPTAGNQQLYTILDITDPAPRWPTCATTSRSLPGRRWCWYSWPTAAAGSTPTTPRASRTPASPGQGT